MLFFVSDPTSTSVSLVVTPWSSLMWSDFFVHVNYTQKSIHRLDVFLHALIPFPLFSCLSSQAFILSSWHCTWSLTLFSSSFSLHMKRSPSFGLGSKTRRVRPTFVLRHSKIPLSYCFSPVVVMACFANCIGGSWLWWYLYCMRPLMPKCIWNVFGKLPFIYPNAYIPY